ncbi:MbtH family protein [Roseibium salinum]|uniref:MbtH family NRPS accessory protein n=1 Tax=Roseibium salinum TaxID=1604349 RepID=A0ABT3QWY5_9HYPH|nr:MbtH family NRPS accessory protein [Roseibium sp. DSM 29163]MCX2721426.1 MbtH family NRPS accessory protein [Roseibium sp. DSM 29163]MDN3721901.1 MbtH family NRPS accessory protein [Roseibium salinum]
MAKRQVPDDQWIVVQNHEGRYSVWPADKTPPAGWLIAGRTGTRQECLAEITRVWTDQRPAALAGFLAALP